MGHSGSRGQRGTLPPRDTRTRDRRCRPRRYNSPVAPSGSALRLIHAGPAPSSKAPIRASSKLSGMVKEVGRKVIASNRKARHDYAILDTYEAGVALVGTEVKSLRLGRASLVEAYATVDDGEGWLRGLNIPEYTLGSWTNHEPRRTRKLLLHKAEIERLIGKIREGGLTLVPLSLYFSDGKVKCELALARGKRSYDKRSDLAKRDANREIQRAYGRAAKGRAREMR